MHSSETVKICCWGLGPVCIVTHTTEKPFSILGDRRVNEQVGIIPMHTIWFRQHNRIAKQLRKQNPHWDGELVVDCP